MTPQQKKAEELTQRIYTWGIKKEGQTLSMKESRELALNAVEEIIKAHPIIPLTYMLESEAIDAAIEYWNGVKKELSNPTYETNQADTSETPTIHG